MLPPPQSFFRATYFKGAEHIQEIIHELFEQQQTRYHEIDDTTDGRMPICVGLHGVGGSGKTTVCNYMLSFYAEEYPGSCCFLQLPSDENQRELLVASMKHILSERGGLQKERLEKINMVEQALPHFHELLRRYRVFLVVDNIWDWALPDVQQILATDYMKGSRLLVTARSRGLLQKLSDARGRPAIHIEHVPSISHAEAIEALKAYSLSSWQGFGTNAEGLLADIARSCFVEKQCHPLLLKVVGARLRHIGGSSHITEGLQNVRSCLQDLKLHGDENIEKGIVSVLRTSYDALNPRLQNILLMLGTCVPKDNYIRSSLDGASGWLQKIYESGSQSFESIRAQMLELEYHGLIQTQKGRVVFIHDLHMVMIDNIVRENKDSPRCFFFEGDATTLSKSTLRSLKFIYNAHGKVTMGGLSIRRQLWKEICDVFTLNWQRATGSDILDVEILRLGDFEKSTSIQLRVLNLGKMRFLRHLKLQNISNIVWVTGWDGAPNLVSVEVNMCRSLRYIRSMTCLSSLKELEFSALGEWKNTGMLSRTLSGCIALERCSLGYNRHICKFPSLTLTNLKELDLAGCEGLRSMEGSECGLTALEELDLAGCSSLKSIPDLKQLVKLRRLMLAWCYALEEVKVGEATLTSLEELWLQCSHTHFSMTGSGSALPISAFSNLRIFHAWGDLERGFTHGRNFDVGRISLPTSLETLCLRGFAEAREMPDLSVLVNLQSLSLDSWSSLTSMTGLGACQSLCILSCPALREVEPSSSSNLEDVTILNCDKLERLPTMSLLRRFELQGCPMVKKEMLPPQVLPALESYGRDISVDWRRD